MTSARRFVITLLSLLAIWAVQGTPVSALGGCVVCWEDDGCPLFEEMVKVCETYCPTGEEPDPECSVTVNTCAQHGRVAIVCEEPN